MNQQSSTQFGTTAQIVSIVIAFSTLNLFLAARYDTLVVTASGTVVVVTSGVACWYFLRDSFLGMLAMPCITTGAVALHINALRALPESHFAVFVMIAILMAYRHWIPIVVAATLVAVHHAVVNELQSLGLPVYCFPDPDRTRVILHAFYVVAEATILVFMTRQSQLAFRTGDQTAALFQHITREKHRFDLRVAPLPATTPTSSSGKNCVLQLANAIGELMEHLEELGVSTQSISESSVALGQRSDTQTATLEAARESLSTLSGQANDNSVLATQAAEQVSLMIGLLTEGARGVHQLLSTMDDLSTISDEIHSIVGVIDGFALQTNMLALNAAVEAARAGDRGRGFAVVASEVRSLSQRVAKSASEITGLIERSGAAVQSCSALANASGAQMEQLVAATTRLQCVAESVEGSARGQTRDLATLSSSVSDLSVAATQNRKLAERTLSMTVTLQNHTDRAIGRISAFVVGDTGADRNEGAGAGDDPCSRVGARVRADQARHGHARAG